MSVKLSATNRSRLLLFLIVALLALRIPFLAGLRLIHWPDYESSEWLWWAYTISTYLLTAIFIFLERGRLGHYHITIVSLILYISLPIIQPLLLRLFSGSLHSGATLVLNRWAQVAIGVLLAAALLLSRKQKVVTGRESLRWLGIAIAVGLLLGVLGWVFLKIQKSGHFSLGPLIFQPRSFGIQLVYSLTFQGSIAAVDEEPLFRGLLWGYLLDRGWSDKRILVVQALLFWSAHIYRAIDQPYSWWILVPLASVLFGWIAWKARSITASMVAHAVGNSLPDALALVWK